MGCVSGKTKGGSKKGNGCCDLSINYDHCCLRECFKDVKEYQKDTKLTYISNVLWYFTDKHKKELLKILTTFKLNYIIPIIINYIQNSNDFIDEHNYSALIHSQLTPINYNDDGICKYFLKFALRDNDEIRIVMLGAGGVGKSSLTIKFVTDNSLDPCDPTIEDSYRKYLTLNVYRDDIDKYNQNNNNNYTEKQQCVLVDILDTASNYNEEFGAMRDQWMREGRIFILIFDVMKHETFEEIQYIRERIIRVKDPTLKPKHGSVNNDFAMIACGNKCDLRNDPTYKSYRNRKKVDISELNKWLNKVKMPYIETSAKLGKNVNFLFRHAVYEYWVQTQTEYKWEKLKFKGS